MGIVANLGGISRKFSQLLMVRRWRELVLTDIDGFISARSYDTPDEEFEIYGVINVVGGQRLGIGEAGARVHRVLDVFTDSYLGIEDDYAYVLVGYEAVGSSGIYWHRVTGVKRWDSGNFWEYRCELQRSGMSGNSGGVVREGVVVE